MTRLGGILIAAAALSLAAACGSNGPVQYPAGQRPCGEALAALGAVTQAQLDAGPGPNDPDGKVRDALEHAQAVLAYRAGESQHYSAATYNALAGTVSDFIGPLRDAYEREDPETPYTEATDYFQHSSAYDTARGRLDDECSGRNDPAPDAPLATSGINEIDFLQLLIQRRIPYDDERAAIDAGSSACGRLANGGTREQAMELVPPEAAGQQEAFLGAAIEVWCPERD